MKVLITILTALSMGSAFAQSHDHHSTHGKSAEKPSSEKKFTPTEDLKVRMDKILALMQELQDKNSDPKVVATYGNKINDVVNDIFKTCKLEPEADQAIHPSLALILQGAGEFKKGRYDAGHAKIHEALLDYGKRFSHEGWKH